MVGCGVGEVFLGALDDGGVVVAGLDVQLVDVAEIAVRQDVVGEVGVGGAEGFVGDDEEVYHGGLVWMGIGSLKGLFFFVKRRGVTHINLCWDVTQVRRL